MSDTSDSVELNLGKILYMSLDDILRVDVKVK